MAGPNRRTFHDRTLLYVMSLDAEVNLDREHVGFVPGGFRLNIHSRPERTRVYHVMQSQTVAGLGYPAINGRINTGGDWLLWRDDDVEYAGIHLSIETDDGAQIFGEYRVIADLEPGGFRRLVGLDKKLGRWKEPLDVPIFIAPLFYSTVPKYAWLNDLFCVGFGRVRVIESEFRRVTYDIYALT